MNHDSEFSNDDTGRYCEEPLTKSRGPRGLFSGACLHSLRASHWRLTGDSLETHWILTGYSLDPSWTLTGR